MVGITTRPNGSRFITFHDGSGQRSFITLGKTPKRYANAVKVKVEDLVSASIHGHAPSDETSRWVAGLDQKLHKKLSAVELVSPRQDASLAEAMERYIDEREHELKPESIRKLRQTQKKLLEHFSPAPPLRNISEKEALA